MNGSHRVQCRWDIHHHFFHRNSDDDNDVYDDCSDIYDFGNNVYDHDNDVHDHDSNIYYADYSVYAYQIMCDALEDFTGLKTAVKLFLSGKIKNANGLYWRQGQN